MTPLAQRLFARVRQFESDQAAALREIKKQYVRDMTELLMEPEPLSRNMQEVFWALIKMEVRHPFEDDPTPAKITEVEDLKTEPAVEPKLSLSHESIWKLVNAKPMWIRELAEYFDTTAGIIRKLVSDSLALRDDDGLISAINL